jgi:hypothetical protein
MERPHNKIKLRHLSKIKVFPKAFSFGDASANGIGDSVVLVTPLEGKFAYVMHPK